MRTGRRLLAGLAAVMMGVAGTAVLQTAASAAPSRAPSGYLLRAKMVVVGFDRSVAEANGYEIRVDSQGRQYSVPKGTPLSVQPNDPVLTGDCGSSFIFFNAYGGHHATVDTGFGVNGSAFQYSWHVSIFDNIGGSTRDWGGGLFFRATWEGTSDFLSGTTGYAWAQVNSATSWASLTDGRVCYSMGPWDWTDIY